MHVWHKFIWCAYSELGMKFIINLENTKNKTKMLKHKIYVWNPLALRFSEASFTRSTNNGSSLFWASISATCNTLLALLAIFDALATIRGESIVRIPSSILSVSCRIASSVDKVTKMSRLNGSNILFSLDHYK